MLEPLRAPLLRALRVPPEPAPPPGDPRLVRTFRAAPNYFRYSVAMWVLKQISAAVGLLFSYLFLRGAAGRVPFAYFGFVEQLFIALFIAQLPLSFALLRLDFELRWYILSDRSLRIREGILAVREQTMTFANIQNIAIRQNPLQRAFGIATVVVRAAGGGGSSQGQRKGAGGGSHEATFEGVDNGEHIRDAIRARIRLHRDAGLGDPEEAGEPVGVAEPGDAVAPAERRDAHRGTERRDAHRGTEPVDAHLVTEPRDAPAPAATGDAVSDAAAPVAAARRLLHEVRELRAALHAGDPGSPASARR